MAQKDGGGGVAAACETRAVPFAQGFALHVHVDVYEGRGVVWGGGRDANGYTREIVYLSI